MFVPCVVCVAVAFPNFGLKEKEKGLERVVLGGVILDIKIEAPSVSIV